MMTSRTPTLLLVEDFPADRELYRRYLRTAGDNDYRLLEAETAKAGLELCRTQVIDAILLDYLLPDANGLQFLEALNAQSQGNSPPVVMVTGEGDETIAVRAIKLGAEDYLVKRYLTPELLWLTMRSAIENARLRLQLQQSENRFRTSVENMLDCFGVYSAIRNATGQIIDFRIDYLNAAALESNQMTLADIGKGLCELLPAHRETGLFAEYCQVAETGKPLIKEGFVYADVFGLQYHNRAYDIRVNQLDDGLVIAWRDVTLRQQVELERQQQLERERILNQLTQQIRRSLDPSEVLNTAVTEVRQFLQADRAFIYRFNPDFSGVIVVESVGEGWMAALNAQVDDTCFMETQGEDYRQGRIQAIADIYTAGLSDCHVAMLAQFQIRANLVVPILQGDVLWGLLVLNQCAHPRQWRSTEVELLQQLALQIGIAIQQSELHQQVQEKQQFIQQLSDAAPGFIYIYDLIEQRNVYSNGGIVNFLGYTPEAIQAMGPTVLPQLFHPEDFAQVAARIAQLQTAQPGENVESEFRLRHADGDWRWFCARETVYRRTPEGIACQILGVAQEITERKRVEALLRESQQRLELSLDATQQGMWDYDFDRDRAYLTPQCKRLLGLNPNEPWATYDQMFACIHPADRAAVSASVLTVMQTQDHYDSEYRVIWPDGSVHWLQAKGKVLRNQTGDRIRLIGTLINISERKQLEAELNQRLVDLQEQQQRSQQLIDNAPIGIGIGSADGTVAVINDEMLRLHGYTRAEFEQQGMNWRDFLPPELQAQASEVMTRLQQVGVLPPEEKELLLPDGSRKPIWISATQWSNRPDMHVAFAVDLTQQKQAEAALQLSQRRYQQLAEAMPQMVWTTDATGQLNYWNQQWYEYTGLSEAESLGLEAVSVVHPEDRDRTLAQWQQAVTQGLSFEIEYRVRRWDGVYHWFISRGLPAYDSQNQVTGWIGTITNVDELKRSQAEREHLLHQLAEDIAVRQQSEERLRQSEARLKLGVQVAGVAIAHFDYTTQQVTLSPEAAALYGFPADQLQVTREDIHATFHPLDAADLIENIRQIISPTGTGWFAREHRVVWPTGEVRWLSVRKQVFFDRATVPNRPVYAILAAIDITERIQTEAALRENEQRLKAVIDNSRAAIFLKDLQGRYLLMNQECAQLFRLTEAEGVGKTDFDLFPSEVAKQLQANDQAVIVTGEALTLEEEVLLEDGTFTYLSVKFPLLDEAGSPYAICGISTDISDRVRLQAERDRLLAATEAARAEAEAINRSKDEFVSLVAHELRSPLNAIMGWAKLLQTRSFDPDMTQKALETITRNTQAQVQLIEDLLDVSRMRRGELRLEFAAVHLADVVEAAIETIRPAAAAKLLHIEVQIHPVLLIEGDPHRLQQVVLNLLTNAIKFTPEGGQIQVLLEQQGTQASLQVRDTGKGIHPDFLPHIFERFRQDTQNTTTRQGLGLGLAIVKYIVEQHGGTVTAASAGDDQGTTFTVMVPSAQPYADLEWAVSSVAPCSETQTLSGVRILLVDDNLDMLNLAALTLREFEAIVQTANRVTVAMQLFPQFQPDVVISDIAMPEQNGYELLRQVRSLETGPPTPAIALTAFASEAYREDSLQAGFAAHLVKPVDPDELVRVILSVLQRRPGV
jgi:PAS domain S-box-containing protein